MKVTQLPGDTTHLTFQAEFPHFSVNQLYDHFIRTELLQRWWPPTAVVDAQVGGKYRLSWPEMGWHLYGEYTRLEPGKHLAFTWKWEHNPDMPTRQVEIAFEPHEAGSLLTLTHGVYGDNARDREDRQHHVEGWSHFLARLQALGSDDPA
jgi:uncharacterized protein YndB with AHSA1/START domain